MVIVVVICADDDISVVILCVDDKVFVVVVEDLIVVVLTVMSNMEDENSFNIVGKNVLGLPKSNGIFKDYTIEKIFYQL